jgi:hypothetical protein
MTILKRARFAALLAGGSLLLAATPTFAQSTLRRPSPNNQPQAQPTPPGQAAQPQRRITLSKPERDAFVPLEQAVKAAQQQGPGANWAAAAALLPAAQSATRGNDARYLLAKLQYAIAVGTNNLDAQEQALAALVAASATPPAEAAEARQVLTRIPHVRAERAFNAGDFASAERIYRKILQANPGDQLAQGNLRITLSRSGNTAGSLQLLQEQIRTAEAGGSRATEEQYRQALGLAQRGNQAATTAAALQALIRNYPTAANWRLAVDTVRAKTAQDNQLLLDTYRFARAANVIQPREYLSLAQTLDQAGLPGETKAVIDAGVAAGAVQSSQTDVARLMSVTNRRIGEDRAGLPGQIQQARSAANGRQARIAADVLYGYGRYAEAAELYRVALSKGGEDANLLNLRLGASLTMAGQRAAAETALKAVTGSRAELASLWLAWLNRRQG